MTLTPAEVRAAAQDLLDAADGRLPLRSWSRRGEPLDLPTAYAIQDELLELRLRRGERVVGAKLGLTSLAKQRQMGVDEPVFGWLTDGMAIPSGVPFQLSQGIHPRAEPELVFHLGVALRGPGVTARTALDACRTVTAGMELIDSRWQDFEFDAADVVADNTSAFRFVTGPHGVDPRSVDLALCGVLLEVDGVLEHTAAGAATMGHPAEALALLANHLGRRGQGLEPGHVVFSGGLTAAVPLHHGTVVDVTFAHLGGLCLRVST